ncbi:MAG: phytoene/squalene synthase family protein [Candidatus Omnitrophica bacterium]|nr:phytoene/squalene synthase family protein [Candidatus Omnitrophota bacterium]
MSMRTNTISLGFKEAEKITKHFAKTFYLASLLLPPDKKRALHSVYAICRICDESVDNQKTAPSLYYLDEIKTDIESAYSESSLKKPLLLAFRKTIDDYKIPKEYFYELLDGMRMDLTKTKYRDFTELYPYCYKVAGVIGLIMLKIFSCEDKRAEKSAIELGIGMQLTNILRDIKEDFKRGRIYIPESDMKKFNIFEQTIAKEQVNENFKAMVQDWIKKTREYYQNTEIGIRLIPSKRCRIVATSMKEMYSRILQEIEKNNYDVFSRRACVSKINKIGIIIRIILMES